MIEKAVRRKIISSSGERALLLRRDHTLVLLCITV
jgi:hypothetical protein